MEMIPSHHRTLSVLAIAGTFVLGWLLIAQVKQARDRERTVNDRRAMFEATLSESGVAVVALDSWGRVTVFSPEAEALTGYSEAEMKGKPLDALMPKEMAAKHRKLIADVMTEQHFWEPVEADMSCQIIRKDGKVIPIGAHIRASGDRAVGILTPR